ncbi:uncharacterized protein LOC127094293 [Lathyrus oleraceus]|uniref:uncharacterized protein LOC127094293 n=1 Tax=Pisum sativum TaxID=3888 RepID=UPI0021CE31A8|nr:uncharacterized protein LOC127094293 [Pisum sativum]
MNINAPFGGKIMIMGGDFRQVLPAIEKGSRGQMISACIVRSQLWATTKILHLRQNMLSIHDHEFAQFLMRIGDGNEPAKEDDMVKMPAEIVIPWEGESSIKKPIQHKFPQLENHGWDASYMVERAILTPKNCDVHMLNDMITNKFPRDEHILLSFDEVESDTHNLYQQEYLRTIAPGHNAGKRAFLPRIKLKTTDGVGLPFVLIRKQFHVKLSFEITINKSQGQTIPNVRIYLPRHVFSHGQLYVALLRGVSRAATRVIIKDGKVEGEEGDFTKNIAFKEILLSQPHVFIYYV